MAKQATAEEQPDGKFKITHEDGSVETLTAKQFHDKYDVDGNGKAEPEPNADSPIEGTQGPEPDQITSDIDGGPIGTQPGDEDPDTLSKRHRPETHDADDAFVEDRGEFADEYGEAVETELKRTEDKIKAVRAELKSLGKQKEGERDFGPLRAAMHELAHGNSLLRTAHPATVRHDGPERLRPAPTVEDSPNSGPGEELNAEQFAAGGRVVGR
jgi:hypothetical protein